MKTAMQEAIDRLVDLSNATFFNGKKSDCDIIDRIKDILRNEYLQKEREQIIDAHNNGKNILPPNENGEQYYNEIYKQGL